MYSMILALAMASGADAPAAGHGCYGGCNGCYGGSYSCYGCNGGYGGCWGGRQGRFRMHGCHGCCGGSYGCYGGYGCQGGAVPPAVQPAPEKVGPPKGPEALGPAPAVLLVNLPADATLTIDNQPTVSTTGSRRFVSPPLERNRDYFYVLKAEILRDGKTLTASQQVMIRAGERTEVTLKIPTDGIARR